MRKYLLLVALMVNGSDTHSFVHRRSLAPVQHAATNTSAPNVEVTLQEVPQEVLKPESGFQDFLQFGQEPSVQPQPQRETTRINRPVRSEVKARNSEPARSNGTALRQAPQKRTTGPAFRGQFYSPQVPLSIDPGLISRWNQNQ